MNIKYFILVKIGTKRIMDTSWLKHMYLFYWIILWFLWSASISSVADFLGGSINGILNTPPWKDAST